MHWRRPAWRSLRWTQQTVRARTALILTRCSRKRAQSTRISSLWQTALEDCKHAAEIGFDLVGTTLCGYTAKTKGTAIPNYDLLSRITTELNVPVIAEGGVWERGQLQKVFSYPVHAAVIGTAITRPRDITRRFVEAIS